MSEIRQPEHRARPDAPGGRGTRITSRSVILGLITSAALAFYGNLSEMVLHSGSMVKSNYPVSLILAFLVWIVLNAIVARIRPRSVLSSTELMVIFGMAWIVGMMPGVGWMGYAIGSLAAPHFFATPENRWIELFLDELPRWAFPEPTAEVIDRFYFGLRGGESIPWTGWAMPLWWWFSVCLAMTGAAFCLTTIFHRQWADAERLTYPLVSFPLELVEDFDRGERIPRVFRQPVFWLGLGWVAGIIFWNILVIFHPGMPRITVLDSAYTKAMNIARDFPPIYLRVMPLVIGLGYLCNLDLLFSFWIFGLLSVLKSGVMNRTGFTVGLPGQPSAGNEIISLESHGAMVVLVVWSVWMARRHLAHVWRAAVSGAGGEEGPISYRWACVGLAACGAYVCGFFVEMGMTLGMALGHMALMFVSYFTAAKYIAASGFGYLFPVWAKGGPFYKAVLGTAHMSARNLTAMALVNDNIFYGTSRLQTVQVLPHHLKAMDGVRENRAWVGGTVFSAFTVGFVVCAGAILYFCYTYSALYLQDHTLWTGPQRLFDRVASSVGRENRTVFDPQKLAIWILGGFEASLLLLLRTRLSWWPVHPLGLAFQFTRGPRYYGFSIFLVWAAKLLILRYGGPRLYRRAKPFFYGTVVGYCIAIAVGMAVDIIWFPGSGHGFHNF